MPSEAIAEHALLAQRPGEAELPVQVVICKPTPSVAMSPAWECSVSLAPLWEMPFVIYGDDSFQALCLASRHAVQMLDTFAEQGGLLKHPDGEPYEANVFGFKLLARAS